MNKKSLFTFIGSLLILFCFTSCLFDKTFTGSKAGQITIKFGSAARSVDLDKIFSDANSFITVNLCGDVEDTLSVKAKQGASVSFKNIPVDSKVYLEAQIYIAEEGRKRILYKGQTDVITIVPGPNPAELKLFSVKENEEQNPADQEFVISINCEDQIFSEGSRIIFTAKDKKGKEIPAEKFTIELYSIYGDDGEELLEKDKEEDEEYGCYYDIRSQNKVIIKTSFPADDYSYLDDLKFYFKVSVEADGETYTKQFDPFAMIPGEKEYTQFEFSTDDDVIYSSGNVITCTAKTENGVQIPADKIDVYLSARTHSSQNIVLSEKQGETGDYTITREDNKVIIAIDFTDSERFASLSKLFINARETYDVFMDFKSIVYDKFSPYAKPESTIIMTPQVTELPVGETITFTATYKDGTAVPAENINIDEVLEFVGIGDKGRYVEVNEGFTIGATADNKGKDFTISDISPHTPIMIIVSIKKPDDSLDYKEFDLMVQRPLITQTIDIGTLSATEITSAITDAAEQMVLRDGVLKLIFTGEKNDDEFNLYWATMEVLRSTSIQVDLTGYEGLIELDYSGCTGTVVSQIPANTFKEVSTIKSFKLSASTTSIGNYAFMGNGAISTTNAMVLDELNLRNVESIGTQAFFRLKVNGTLNIPKATSFGGMAFDYLEAGTVNLVSAEHLYDISGNNETAVSIFSNSKIDTLIAPKLKTIGQQTFDGATIGNFQIPDSLILIGRYGFRNATIRNLTFESSEAANSWYIIRSGFTINGEYVNNTKIAQGIFKGTYKLDTLLALPESEGNIELLTAEQLKQEMTGDKNAGYWFVR